MAKKEYETKHPADQEVLDELRDFGYIVVLDTASGWYEVHRADWTDMLLCRWLDPMDAAREIVSDERDNRRLQAQA